MGVDFDILILMLNTKREIAMKKKLFNSIIAGEPLYLTDIKIDEGRD